MFKKVNKLISQLRVNRRLVLFFILFYSYVSISFLGKYNSDIKDHIDMSYLGIFYSLMGTIIKMILTLSGDYASILISILLSSFIIFSIFETEKIINYLLEKFRIKINKDICFFISICLIFITAIYIPGYSPIVFGKFFTKNKILITSMSAQPWHNTTYIGMRLFALQVMYKYMYILIENDIKFKDYVEFLILLLLVNAVKPNFIIAFAPMVGLFIIYDFFSSLWKKKKVDLKKFLFLSICLIVSTVVLYFQYKILYSKDSGSSVAFTLKNFKPLILERNFYKISLLGVIFPIIVLLSCIKNRYLPKILFQSWVLFFISFLERIFFIELGYREKHGNFFWGGYFAGYFLFLVSIVLILVMYNKKIISKKEYYIFFVIFLLHVVSGIIYFLMLLSGDFYVLI